MQKVKINQFNFLINETRNEPVILNNTENNLKFKYFFIDGMESTLFVENDINVAEFEEQSEQHYTNIINYRTNINKQINKLIEKKVESLMESGNYSRYELYDDFQYHSISNFLYEREKYFNEKYDRYSYFKLDLDKNIITAEKVSYNPYTNKVENFEELYSEGVFKDEIETRLVIKEYEKGIMPKYIYELMSIYNFLKDKQTINIKLKDCEKYKVDACFGNILDRSYWNKEYSIANYVEDSFKRANPLKKLCDMKIDDLEELTFGKKEKLQINVENLKNIEEQIAINGRDKLIYKLKKMSKELDTEFCKYKERLNGKIQTNLDVRDIQFVNNMFKEKEWYSKEWKQIPKDEIGNLEYFNKKSLIISSLKNEFNYTKLRELINMTKDEELKKIEKQLKFELDKIQRIEDSKLNNNEDKILKCIMDENTLEMYGIKNCKSIIKQIEIAINEFNKIKNEIEKANNTSISWTELYNKYNGYWKKIFENGDVQFGVYSKPIEFTVTKMENGNIEVNSKDVNIFPDNITDKNTDKELFNLDFSQEIDFEKIKRIVARDSSKKKEKCEEVTF